MTALVLLITISLIIFSGGNMPGEKKDIQTELNELIKLKITIIYDNYPFNSRLETEWGFSCLIEGLEKTILFDTGGDGKILLNNMKNLNINPDDINMVFLSHEHWDHTGGLSDFLKQNSKVIVYLLPSFPSQLKSMIKNNHAIINEIDRPAYFCERVGATGELGIAVKEQSLVIETAKGLVIITGCAHPGIVDIIKYAKENYEDEVYLVFGGFHLHDFSDTKLQRIIKQFRELGVKKVGPCHCSGDRCRRQFKEEYQKDYIEVGVGKIIQIE